MCFLTIMEIFAGSTAQKSLHSLSRAGFFLHQLHEMNKDLFFMCMLLTMNDREIDSNQAQ